MNITGLGPYKWKYKIDRPLVEEEKLNCLHKKDKASKEPDYDLSVICLNSTYMELVDRWYSSKGHAVVYGIMGVAPFVLGAVIMLVAALERQGTFAMWFGLGISFLFSLVAICFFICFVLRHFEELTTLFELIEKIEWFMLLSPMERLLRHLGMICFFARPQANLL